MHMLGPPNIPLESTWASWGAPLDGSNKDGHLHPDRAKGFPHMLRFPSAIPETVEVRHQSTAIAEAATFALVGEGVLFQLSPNHLRWRWSLLPYWGKTPVDSCRWDSHLRPDGGGSSLWVSSNQLRLQWSLMPQRGETPIYSHSWDGCFPPYGGRRWPTAVAEMASFTPNGGWGPAPAYF